VGDRPRRRRGRGAPGPARAGLGYLSRLLRTLAERGWTTVRLDTNRNLTEAIAMYRSAGYREIEAGYREIEPYNTERYAHHWFEKHLAA
jgi:ribosomal protein S18 acetylase RimI-like enzyme